MIRSKIEIYVTRLHWYAVLWNDLVWYFWMNAAFHEIEKISRRIKLWWQSRLNTLHIIKSTIVFVHRITFNRLKKKIKNALQKSVQWQTKKNFHTKFYLTFSLSKNRVKKPRNYYYSTQLHTLCQGCDLCLCVCVRSWKCNMQKNDLNIFLRARSINRVYFYCTLCTTFALFHWRRSAIFTIFPCNHTLVFYLYDSLNVSMTWS